MSSPYVYTPRLYPAVNPYVDAQFSQSQHSPFIPDANLYPPSPYASASNTPRRVRFQDLPSDIHPRPRRPSWHGGEIPVTPGSVPFPQSSYSPLLVPDPLPFHQRRHSFGASGHQPPSWAYPAQSYPPWLYSPGSTRTLLHPFLNAESPHAEFYFDISFPRFAPVLWYGRGQAIPLTMDHYAEPATHPPITRMRIVCDRLPQWPIDLEYDPYQQGSLGATSPPVPVTLSDVLVAIHRSLHMRISHLDWSRLTISEQTAVARAYTKRCASIPSVSEYEASQGVRRIDYLLDKVVFRGLLRTSTSTDGAETYKLILG